MSDFDVHDFEDAEELFEHAPCAYLSILMDGTIAKANETFCEWTGFSKTELVTKLRIQELFTDGGRIFYETHVSPLIQMQGYVREIQFDLLSKSGRLLPTLLNAAVRKESAGPSRSIRVTLYDIADRKRFEKDLIIARKRAEKATQAKSEFISMLSHEIRTPMNAIIGIANLFESTELSERQKEYLRILRFSSEHLLGLINDILDFSKIEAGRAVLVEKNFNLRELVSGIAMALKVKADEKGIDLRVEVDPAVPGFINADPFKIGQVLTNLVGNAIKFTAKGFVEIKVNLKQKFARSVSLDFQVIDTGVGISSDQLSSIFEEFVQANHEISMTYGGTGLGLAISQKLIKLYGSQIEVQSREGRGSEFRFNLILRIGEETHEAFNQLDLKDSMPKKQAFRGLRALIVEDNKVNAFILGHYLEGWGISYEVAVNGKAGLEKAIQTQFDLILMDIRMPVMTGFQATQAIRNQGESYFKNVPIIALSASTKLGLTDHLGEIEFTDFVAKPFRPEELFQKIALHCRETLSTQGPQAAPFSQLTPRPQDLECEFTVARYREALGSEVEGLQEVLCLIVESYQAMKPEIEVAIRSSNLVVVGALAHKIKMSTQMLGALRLEKSLERIKNEMLLGSLSLDQIDLSVNEVQSELDRLIGLLKGELSSLETITP